MKRAVIAAGALGVVLIVGGLWFVHGEEEGGEASRAAATAAGGAAHPSRSANSIDPSSTSNGVAGTALAESLAESGAPGSTRPVSPPMTAADGFVQVRVLAQGKPFAGAKVRLYWRGTRDRQTRQIDWRLAGAAQTGKDGIAKLPARQGSYLATARGTAFAPAHQEFQRPSGEQITKIALELTAGLALTGRTMQKGGKEPVPLAQVTLAYDDGALQGRGGRGRVILRGPRPPGDMPVEEELRATSDEQGRFHFDGLEAGAYRATASATGYAKANARAEVPAAKELVLELAQSSFIEGYVITSDGKAAAGAEVMALNGPEPYTATASEKGAFSIEVAPRTYSLVARHGGEAGRADAQVTVAAGATEKNVRITLGAAAQIAGTVVAGANGAPIPGAQILVSAHGGYAPMGSATSDPVGAFAVAGLAPGSYDVVATAQGYSDGTYSGVTVDAAQKFPLRVTLHQTGSISGLVTDSAGRGVAFALVQTLQGGFGPFGMGATPQQPLQARADETGAYTLSGVAPGHLQFTALRDGSQLGATATADVPEGGNTRLDFQLHDEGAVAGHLRRADGSPAPAGSSVRAMPADNRFMRGDWAAIPVDATGAFVASLPAGPYSLSANGSGAPGPPGPGGRNFVEVEAGKTATLDLVYTDASDPGAGFSGNIFEPGGAPSPGAMVRGSGGGRGGMFFAQADEAGHFVTNRQRADLPDTFQIVAMNGGRTGTAAVAPGQAEATLTLQPAATLNGHLTSGPVDQFTVVLSLAPSSGFPMAGPPQSLQFSGDHFQMRDVPGTAVHLVVTTVDGRSAQADVTLVPGGTQEVEIPLQPLATVTGRLVDSITQAPVANAMLFISGTAHTQSANDGSFSLQVAAGTLTLQGFAPNYRPLSQEITAVAGQPAPLGNVVMTRQTAASGTIGATVRGTPALVVMILPQGPADAGGLHIGDQIVAVDGQQTPGAQAANALLNGAPNSPCSLSLSRNGSLMTLSITRAP